ncbi:MAG: AAA family ATPase, partial [Planctomycetota bacterium]|nr:AAA family ATPase [Planctomycetota bacterium]
MADLAAGIGLPLLIVARAALGTINHTALTISEARRRGLRIAGIVINSPDRPDDEDLARSNRAEIERLCGVKVLAALGYDPGRDAARAAMELARQAD